jgi:hypothetical protein
MKIPIIVVTIPYYLELNMNNKFLFMGVDDDWF